MRNRYKNRCKNYFTFEKIGDEYYIKKIHDIPIQKPTTRKKHSQYADWIYPIILDELFSMNKDSLTDSAFHFAVLFGMVSDNFYSYGDKNKILKDEKIKNYASQLLKNFQWIGNKEYTRVLSIALENLEKLGLIKYKKGRLVGEILKDEESYYRFATEQEENIIQTRENDFLQEYKLTSRYEAVEKGL